MERSRFKDQRCVTKARFGFLKWIQPDSNHIQSNDVPTQSPNSSKLGRFLQAATCRSYEQIKDRCFHKVWLQVSFSQDQLFPVLFLFAKYRAWFLRTAGVGRRSRRSDGGLGWIQEEGPGGALDGAGANELNAPSPPSSCIFLLEHQKWEDL